MDVDRVHVLRAIRKLPVAARLSEVDDGVDPFRQPGDVQRLRQVLDDPLAVGVLGRPHERKELVPLFQPVKEVAADKPGSACDEDPHRGQANESGRLRRR